MGGTREPWYKNAIIYGVDVATFQDANGDGIGDFMGA
jgi:maltose alpha-D-glucosyltransferase/alpha-amylase